MTERLKHLRHLNDHILERPGIERRNIAREAVRVVMLDEKKRVILMHVSQYGIYKLPGGGVREDEILAEARKREIREETGCELKKVVKLGITTENRKGKAEGGMFQISHCYLAEAVPGRDQKLTQKETDEGFSLHWADNIDQAIELVKGSTSERYDDRYIRVRDSTILETAKQYLESTNY